MVKVQIKYATAKATKIIIKIKQPFINFFVIVLFCF